MLLHGSRYMVRQAQLEHNIGLHTPFLIFSIHIQPGKQSGRVGLVSRQYQVAYTIYHICYTFMYVEPLIFNYIKINLPLRLSMQIKIGFPKVRILGCESTLFGVGAPNLDHESSRRGGSRNQATPAENESLSEKIKEKKRKEKIKKYL